MRVTKALNNIAVKPFGVSKSNISLHFGYTTLQSAINDLVKPAANLINILDVMYKRPLNGKKIIVQLTKIRLLKITLITYT